MGEVRQGGKGGRERGREGGRREREERNKGEREGSGGTMSGEGDKGRVMITAHLSIAGIQLKSFSGINESIAITLSLEVSKAPVAVIHSHCGVEVNGARVQVDGLVKMLL